MALPQHHCLVQMQKYKQLFWEQNHELFLVVKKIMIIIYKLGLGWAEQEKVGKDDMQNRIKIILNPIRSPH